MARYQVILSYDGTLYRGFQRLKAVESENDRSIQGTVETTLRSLGWEGNTILSAGRTDAGVHAIGQVIAFDLEWRHSESALHNALNARLPRDISACEVRMTQDDFHPRYDAKARWYSYRMFCDKVRRPIEERYAWRIWPPITGTWASKAASYLTGRHDFWEFGKSPKPGGSTVRTVYQSEWREWQGYWIYDIVANAFLQHMVRRIVKALVDIGQGKNTPDSMIECLNNDRDDDVDRRCFIKGERKLVSGGEKRFTGMAPPHGLHLLKVFYLPFEEKIG